MFQKLLRFLNVKGNEEFKALPIKKVTVIGNRIILSENPSSQTFSTASFTLPDRVTAIDFETANKNPNSAISLGITMIESGKITEEKHWLIKPPRLVFNEDFIALHGIKPEDVRDQPNFKEIYSEILPYLQNTVLAAHNAPFDKNVLNATAKHYEINLPRSKWICSLDYSRKNFPHLKNHKLSTVAQHIDFKLDHHNASSDARCCAEIFLFGMRQ